MWNNNTKIMTAPVNLDDIAAAGNYAGENMVANGFWNKWAIYKWVKAAAIGMVTPAMRVADDQGFVNILFTDATACFNRAKAMGADHLRQVHHRRLRPPVLAATDRLGGQPR